MKILVGISYYNGSQFFDEQLESIIKQKTQWKFDILIRNDGSSKEEETKLDSVVEKYSKKFEGKITIDNAKNVGVANSFGLLLDKSFKAQYDFLFFSDQDDIWMENKVESQTENIIRNEAALDLHLWTIWLPHEDKKTVKGYVWAGHTMCLNLNVFRERGVDTKRIFDAVNKNKSWKKYFEKTNHDALISGIVRGLKLGVSKTPQKLVLHRHHVKSLTNSKAGYEEAKRNWKYTNHYDVFWKYLRPSIKSVYRKTFSVGEYLNTFKDGAPKKWEGIFTKMFVYVWYIVRIKFLANIIWSINGWMRRRGMKY